MIAVYTPLHVLAQGGNSRYFGPPYLTGARRVQKQRLALWPPISNSWHVVHAHVTVEKSKQVTLWLHTGIKNYV